MLLNIKFNSNYRCFAKDETFNFKNGINLLVGDQGCGKTTLLSLLQKSKDIITIKTDGNNSYRFFDFEKNNPRVGRIETLADVYTVFSSHGESVNAIIKAVETLKEGIILMDEPDMALSVRSCYKLVNFLKEISNNGKQIIAAVHNPIVIAGVGEVLSIEHKRWISSEDFLKFHSEIT